MSSLKRKIFMSTPAILHMPKKLKRVVDKRHNKTITKQSEGVFVTPSVMEGEIQESKTLNKDRMKYILHYFKKDFFWHVMLRRFEVALNTCDDNEIDRRAVFLEVLNYELRNSQNFYTHFLEDKTHFFENVCRAPTKKKLKQTPCMRWWNKEIALILMYGKELCESQVQKILRCDWLQCPGRCGRTLRIRNPAGFFSRNPQTCPHTCELSSSFLLKKCQIKKELEKVSKRATCVGHKLRHRIQYNLQCIHKNKESQTLIDL